MSAPYTGLTLEEQLARMKALLRVVDHVLEESSDDDELRSGAEICLEHALDVLDRIQVGLSARVMNTEIVEGGAR